MNTIGSRHASLADRHTGGLILGAAIFAAGLSFVAARPLVYPPFISLLDRFVWPRHVEAWRHAKVFEYMPVVGALGMFVGVALVAAALFAPGIVTRGVDAVRGALRTLSFAFKRRIRAGEYRFDPATLIPVLVALGVPALTIALGGYVWYLGEDGVSETTTVIAYLIGSLLLVIAAFRLRKERRWWALIPYLLLAAGAFVVAMEEISWGQRLLGYSTPEIVESRNIQDEFNLHNIREFGQWETRFLATAAAVGLLGVIASMRLRDKGRSVPWLERLLPPPWLLAPLAVLFIYTAFPPRVLLTLNIENPSVLQETYEPLTALIVMFYAGWALRRSRDTGPPPERAGGAPEA
jgi:hypothetical protein